MIKTKEVGYVVEEVVDPFTPTWESVTVPIESIDRAVKWINEWVNPDSMDRYRIVLVFEIENIHK